MKAIAIKSKCLDSVKGKSLSGREYFRNSFSLGAQNVDIFSDDPCEKGSTYLVMVSSGKTDLEFSVLARLDIK